MLLDWSREDSSWLRQVLSQPSGQKLVEVLRGLIPKVKSVTKENAWIQAVEKQGAENLFEKFIALSRLEAPDTNEGTESVDLTQEGD